MINTTKNRVFISACLMSICTFQLYSHTEVISYLSELFTQDPIPTESFAYRLLQENPIPNTQYVAIPWAVLINTRKLNLIPPFKVNNGVTVCQHIRYQQIIPLLKKTGIATLFTPHAQKNKQVIDGVTILPFPHYAINGIHPAPIKDIFYSFIGADNHPVKKKLFAMNHPTNCVVKKRDQWHFARDTFLPNYNSKEEQEHERLEYQDVLARSRFSLCPRGTGPSSLRFWESLQAGAIPVLISDELALPEGLAWETCVIQIPENSIEKINTILGAITHNQEQSMRTACLQAYQLFSGSNFVRPIRLYQKQQENQ